MRVRSNSCTRAYVSNGIGIALIAVLNQVGIVISDEVVVVIWLPAGPTKCIVIGSIKMTNAHAVAIIRETRMSILTLKIAVTIVSCNFCKSCQVVKACGLRPCRRCHQGSGSSRSGNVDQGQWNWYSDHKFQAHCLQ